MAEALCHAAQWWFVTQASTARYTGPRSQHRARSHRPVGRVGISEDSRSERGTARLGGWL